MTIKTDISAEEFEGRFFAKVNRKATKKNDYYGKIGEGQFVLRNSERNDTLVKGKYTDGEDGLCTVEYEVIKSGSDKAFWSVYSLITAFFTVALLKDYPIYSGVAAGLLVFGIVCALLKPRKFCKKLGEAVLKIAQDNDLNEKSDECEETEETEATETDTDTEATEQVNTEEAPANTENGEAPEATDEAVTEETNESSEEELSDK